MQTAEENVRKERMRVDRQQSLNLHRQAQSSCFGERGRESKGVLTARSHHSSRRQSMRVCVVVYVCVLVSVGAGGCVSVHVLYWCVGVCVCVHAHERLKAETDSDVSSDSETKRGKRKV